MCKIQNEGSVTITVSEYNAMRDQIKDQQKSLEDARFMLDNKSGFLTSKERRYKFQSYDVHVPEFYYVPEFEDKVKSMESKIDQLEEERLKETAKSKTYYQASVDLNDVKSKWWYKLFKNL